MLLHKEIGVGERPAIVSITYPQSTNMSPINMLPQHYVATSLTLPLLASTAAILKRSPSDASIF
jgi:hypothetical protein